MKRDMDLVRKICLFTEENTRPSEQMVKPVIDGYGPEGITHHIHLLQQADLVTARAVSDPDGYDLYLVGLTWAGHDFLDAARNYTVWNNVKAQAQEMGLALTFELLKKSLVAAAAAQLGIKA